jgi:hypothetical protein
VVGANLRDSRQVEVGIAIHPERLQRVPNRTTV